MPGPFLLSQISLQPNRRISAHHYHNRAIQRLKMPSIDSWNHEKSTALVYFSISLKLKVFLVMKGEISCKSTLESRVTRVPGSHWTFYKYDLSFLVALLACLGARLEAYLLAAV